MDFDALVEVERNARVMHHGRADHIAVAEHGHHSAGMRIDEAVPVLRPCGPASPASALRGGARIAAAKVEPAPDRIGIQLGHRTASELTKVDLAQPVANLDLHSQTRGQRGGCLQRPLRRAAVDRRNPGASQSLGKGGSLSSAPLAERNAWQPCRNGLTDVIVAGVADQE